MGFCGNTNGQAVLAANNAFSAANAVTLGSRTSARRTAVQRDGGLGSEVEDDPAEHAERRQPDPSALRPRSVDSGININSFNTLLAQTLALSYNNLYKTGFTGQSIGGMGCTPLRPDLGQHDQRCRHYANGLIGNAIKGLNNGSEVTQTQIGNLNTLLGCMNAEA